MADSTVTQVCDALAAAIATVDGLRVSAHPVASPNPPHAQVLIRDLEYHASFGAPGMSTLRATVQVLLGRVVERVALERIDTYASPSGTGSVVAAIEADGTLGGVVQALKVERLANIGTVTIGELQYLAASIDVVVYL